MNDPGRELPPGALSTRYANSRTVYSVLGSVTRREPWEPPETMRAVSVLGSIVLDYRDANLPLGVTAVDCRVFLGSVEIIVPSDVDVELNGTVILGSVQAKSDRGPLAGLRRVREFLTGEERGLEADAERPLLCIDCSGVMGSVELKVL